MGISTLQSYCGAQIFEAVGLDRTSSIAYFTSTRRRASAASDIDVIARRGASSAIGARFRRAAGRPPSSRPAASTGGAATARYHLFNPETVYKLQHATRSGQYAIYKEYTALVDDQSRALGTLRGLLDFKPAAQPIPLEEVEPAEAIVKRFATGAMSYGSISQEAHETLAIAMNRLGGEVEHRRRRRGSGAVHAAMPNGDSRRSAIKQVASAASASRASTSSTPTTCRSRWRRAQSPAKAASCPGHKVYPWIAQGAALDARRRR